VQEIRTGELLGPQGEMSGLWQALDVLQQFVTPDSHEEARSDILLEYAIGAIYPA
jgi:hypothetical protein